MSNLRSLTQSQVAVALVTAVVVLVAGETLVARFHFRHALATSVAYRKEQALVAAGKDGIRKCSAAKSLDARSSGTCATLCAAARDSAEMRRQLMRKMREDFPRAAIVARLFDAVRFVAQETRVEELLAKKTCLGLLQGVDRPQLLLDYLCAGILIVAYVLGRKCIPAAEQGLRDAGSRACLLPHVCWVVFTTAAQPFFAVAGALIATCLPEIVALMVMPYEVMGHFVAAVRMEFQLGVAVALGAAFLLSSSSASVVCLEWLLCLVLRTAAVLEGGSMVLSKLQGCTNEASTMPQLERRLHRSSTAPAAIFPFASAPASGISMLGCRSPRLQRSFTAPAAAATLAASAGDAACGVCPSTEMSATFCFDAH